MQTDIIVYLHTFPARRTVVMVVVVVCRRCIVLYTCPLYYHFEPLTYLTISMSLRVALGCDIDYIHAGSDPFPWCGVVSWSGGVWWRVWWCGVATLPASALLVEVSVTVTYYRCAL